MEGKHDEVLASRVPRSSQAHIAVADVGDTGTVHEPDDNDYEVMDLTSIKLAAMSITRPLSAESIAYSSYAMSTITKSPIPDPATITPAYLVSSKITQNLVLDSACTQHIICNRSLFWSYDPAGAKSVGTANCGCYDFVILSSYGDKGRFGSYLKLCDFTLLSMTLQVELRLNKRIISETQTS